MATRAMPGHTAWLTKLDETLTTADGREITAWELVCDYADEDSWRAWATHFRQHYCLDSEIDALKAGTEFEDSRANFLKNLVFPDGTRPPGPGIRSGDFGEILVSDLLEFHEGYWVPRTQYAHKAIRNESSKGTDIVGIKIVSGSTDSPDDELITFEAKVQATGSKAKSRLQAAVDDALKDKLRLAETLNATKHRLLLRGKHSEAAKIQRFQAPLDRPYRQLAGAAALFTLAAYDSEVIQATDASRFEPAQDLKLIVVRADSLMKIVTMLFERAADEA